MFEIRLVVPPWNCHVVRNLVILGYIVSRLEFTAQDETVAITYYFCYPIDVLQG